MNVDKLRHSRLKDWSEIIIVTHRYWTLELNFQVLAKSFTKDVRLPTIISVPSAIVVSLLGRICYDIYVCAVHKRQKDIKILFHNDLNIKLIYRFKKIFLCDKNFTNVTNHELKTYSEFKLLQIFFPSFFYQRYS